MLPERNSLVWLIIVRVAVTFFGVATEGGSSGCSRAGCGRDQLLLLVSGLLADRAALFQGSQLDCCFRIPILLCHQRKRREKAKRTK